MAMIVGGETGDFQFTRQEPDLNGTNATQTEQAPTTPTDQQQSQQQPAGKIQDDPVFRSLPRDIQKRVEAGMPLDQAVQLAAKGGGNVGAKVENIPAQPMPQSPAPKATPQARPNVPVTPGRGVDRLSLGQALEGGRSGRDTFARPGQRSFQAFRGQEFNPFLLRAEAGRGGTALSARDALNTGAAGRTIVGGTGADSDPFLKELIGG